MPFTASAQQANGDIMSASAWNRFVDNLNWRGKTAPKCKVTGCQDYLDIYGPGGFREITWNQEVYSVGGLHSTIVEPSRFTAPYTGWYYFGAHMVFDIQDTSEPLGATFLTLWANNVIELARRDQVASDVIDIAMHLETILYLVAGDYLQVKCFVSRQPTFLANDQRCAAMMHWLSS